MFIHDLDSQDHSVEYDLVRDALKKTLRDSFQSCEEVRELIKRCDTCCSLEELAAVANDAAKFHCERIPANKIDFFDALLSVHDCPAKDTAEEASLFDSLADAATKVV